MKELSNLKKPEGAKKRPKRIGRGPGSGHGKTSTKGHKGQRARSGGYVPPYFEGGQMPLYRRLPKRGFKNPFRLSIACVNVGQLNRFENGAVVDVAALEAAGLVRGRPDGVKCLGHGDLEKQLTVRLTAFSASAKSKIEGRNGKAEVIGG
jgi:large subunit ribosomal protein L15